MDYRDYRPLIERYNALPAVSAAPGDTEESLIQKLMANSREKNQILCGTNAIIREYIVKYEKNPSLLDEEAVLMLRDFFTLLLPSGRGGESLDPCLSLRIGKLLLQRYQSVNDSEQIAQMLYWCTMLQILVKDHRSVSGSSPYALMAEEYLKDFDVLSEQGKSLLVTCWLLCVYNNEDLTFGLRKLRDIQRRFEPIRQKMGADYELKQYIGCQTYVLCYAMWGWHKAESQSDAASVAIRRELAQNADLVRELAQELREALLSDRVLDLFGDRVTTWYYVAQADHFLGRITGEQLLRRMEELMQPQEDYRPLELCSARVFLKIDYLDYLRKHYRSDRKLLLSKTLAVIADVRKDMADAVKGLSELSQYISIYQSNLFMLELIKAASSTVEFDYFKRIVLDSTVYANKELYIHTMMVQEICLVLLNAVLDRMPEYLDGVAGQSWTYWRDHRDEALRLMENSALLHDIGKYYCLDFVNNSSRSLTDEEFEVIKEHPLNFSAIYQGDMNPEIECMRDCAQLHHLWYDGTAGYPLARHTNNKPFVNILTISDCIDAATDNIGRPYGMGKTLEQLIAEFDAARGTRYCGVVSGLLHLGEVQDSINRIINERRKQLYCDILFHPETN